MNNRPSVSFRPRNQRSIKTPVEGGNENGTEFPNGESKQFPNALKRGHENKAVSLGNSGSWRWLGREGSNLRMAESKSAEFTSKINEPSEFSSSVPPLTALANFLRSECDTRRGSV